MWSSILEVYQGFAGNGFFLGFYLLSLGYLFFSEKNKVKRCMLVYVPLLLWIVFFNPLTVWFLNRFADNEIYYRMLWILPLGVTVAYAALKLLLEFNGRKRYLLFAVMLLVLMLSGDYVYDNSYFTKAENPYHVPETVVEICDSIVIEGREVCAVFPNELLQYVRQYTPYVCMPYGREMIVDRWNLHHPLYYALQEAVIDTKRLAETAREYNCHYIILSEQKEKNGDLEEEAYKRIQVIDGYEVYLDETADLGR